MRPAELTSASVVTDQADDVSLASVVRGISRNRSIIVGTAIVVAVLTGVYAATRPVGYSSMAWFMPQAPKQSSAVAGLAAQFGINVNLNQGGMSAQSYADLVQSREILLPLAQLPYDVPRGGKTVRMTLVDIYSPNRGVYPARRDAAVGQLGKQVKATVLKTGAVELTVTTPSPSLSQQLALNILAQVDSFNLRNRLAEATPERAFVEQRVAVAASELHQAEDRLEGFLESNRQLGTSPQLQLEKDRLTRAVSMRQQVYTSLAQAYEQARIDEIRNMPSIIVLERPELPYAPRSKRIPAAVILGLALGTVLGLMLAFLLDAWKNIRRIAAEDPSSAAPTGTPARTSVAVGK